VRFETCTALNRTYGYIVPEMTALDNPFTYRIAYAATDTATFIIVEIPSLNTIVAAIRWIVEAPPARIRANLRLDSAMNRGISLTLSLSPWERERCRNRRAKFKRPFSHGEKDRMRDEGRKRSSSRDQANPENSRVGGGCSLTHWNLVRSGC
jgi:hypothetical protein